jgi:broad specificity phosphatase PhoE
LFRVFGGDAGAARSAVGGVPLDDAEVRSRWWSAGPEVASGVGGVGQRLYDLMDQVKYAPSEVVVLVGHSHLMRELLKAQISERFAQREPQLCADLRKLKLSNCGVARLELDFDEADAPIVGCRLLAGTELLK